MKAVSKVRNASDALDAPAARKERPDDRSVPGMHRRQTARAGAAHQAQQERLGLIVSGVADRHDLGVEMRPGAREELIARLARRGLDGSALAPYSPPVSNNSKVCPRQKTGRARASRVVPATGATIARRLPVIRSA